jgi:dTDP-L-rhamnose 4-epimerase
VQDVVDANMLVLENDGANFQALNVGSGKATTVLDYAKTVMHTLRCSADLHVSGEYRRGDNRHSVSNVEKLQSLSWRPRRDISVILDDFLHWIESIGGIPEQVDDAYSEMKNAGVVLSSVT